MVTPRTPKTKLTDRKRAAILNAAVKEFLASGFDLTSMDKIAQTAGVSKRTVYNHFSSKDDLFQAIVMELVARADLLPDFPYDPKQSVERQLMVIAKGIVRAVSDQQFQNLSRVVVSRLITAPEYGDLIAEQTAGISAKLASWLKAAHKSRSLNVSNPEMAAEQFKGLLLAHFFWPRLIGIKKPVHYKSRDDFVKDCVKLFLSRYAR